MAYITQFRGKWRAQVQKHGQRLSKVAETEEEAKLWAEHLEGKLDATAKRYRPRVVPIGGPNLVTMVPRSVLEAAREAPHSLIDILEAAVPTTHAPAIYFLIRDGEVNYVGQSIDVLGRISRHRREGRQFDAYAYIECAKEDLDRLERVYIRALVPEGNMSFGNRDLTLRHQPRPARGDSQTPEPR